MTKKTVKYDIPKEYLGAFKAGHRPSVREFIDEELSWDLLKKIKASNFTDKVSMDALAYITKFNNEFHKNVVSKEDPLHKCTCPNRKKGDKHLEGCFRNDLNDRENAKNRDIMSVNKHKIQSLEQEVDERESNSIKKDLFLNKSRDLYSHEDTVIDLINAIELVDHDKEPVN